MTFALHAIYVLVWLKNYYYRTSVGSGFMSRKQPGADLSCVHHLGCCSNQKLDLGTILHYTENRANYQAVE
jgi:hypothetical protein